MTITGNYLVTDSEGERIAAFSTESDKQLFEAASDMLTALRLAEERVEMNNYDREEDAALATIRAAIKKAEG